jgi:hypothetical protein
MRLRGNDGAGIQALWQAVYGAMVGFAFAQPNLRLRLRCSTTKITTAAMANVNH